MRARRTGWNGNSHAAAADQLGNLPASLPAAGPALNRLGPQFVNLEAGGDGGGGGGRGCGERDATLSLGRVGVGARIVAQVKVTPACNTFIWLTFVPACHSTNQRAETFKRAIPPVRAKRLRRIARASSLTLNSTESWPARSLRAHLERAFRPALRALAGGRE